MGQWYVIPAAANCGPRAPSVISQCGWGCVVLDSASHPRSAKFPETLSPPLCPLPAALEAPFRVIPSARNMYRCTPNSRYMYGV